MTLAVQPGAALPLTAGSEESCRVRAPAQCSVACTYLHIGRRRGVLQRLAVFTSKLLIKVRYHCIGTLYRLHYMLFLFRHIICLVIYRKFLRLNND